MTVVRVLIACGTERDRRSELPVVLAAKFHQLTLVTVFAFHTPSTNGAGRAIPLSVHSGRITQPTQHLLGTTSGVTEDIAERGQDHRA